MSQKPSIGRIVHYTLSEQDAERIAQQRGVSAPNIGSAAGNGVSGGEIYPLIITRVWGQAPESAVNGQVMLDGNDTLWVTSVQEGDGPRTFAWPPRV